MARPYRFMILASLLCLAIGKTLAAPSEAEAPSPSNLTSEVFYQLLLGELSAQRGDAPSAYALMLDAARKTNSAQLYERAIDFALSARSGESALRAAQAWGRAQPNSREATRYQIQILIGMNRVPEIQELLRRDLASLNPKERIAAIDLLPRYFVRAPNPQLAAITIEQTLLADLNNSVTGAAAWSTVGSLRLMAGDADAALQAMHKGLALNPQADQPVLLGLALTGSQAQTAEPWLRKYFATRPSAQARMAYARKLLDALQFHEAYEQIKRITTEKPDFVEAWLIRGSLEVQEKKWSAAEASLKKYIALSAPKADTAPAPEMSGHWVQAHLLLAQVEEQRQHWDAALAYLDKLDNPQDTLRVQGRRAMIWARQGKLDAARQLIRELPVDKPEDARTKISLEVQLLRENKLYPEAYQLLANALERTPNDLDWMYDQAMLAEKIGKLDEMEQLLLRIIAAKPDFHHAYNALGYALADRNMRLEQARQLIQKAQELAPNDPYIQDSMAWVEFRSGNATEALRLLQTAYKARPDAEIAAHMGEVLWSLGQRHAATEVWKQGIGLSPSNEVLIETIGRLSPKP